MITGTLNAANTEAENVKTAALAFYAEKGAWTGVNAATGYPAYLTGTPKATYHFVDSGTTNLGLIDGVGNPGVYPTVAGTTSSGWSGITWKGTVGAMKWERT
jgi:hypothetical protein